MSAGLVDLGNTLMHVPSIMPANGVGSSPASGEIVGLYGDLRDANCATNLMVAHAGVASGLQFRVQVQTSLATTSGTFTDPTSGLQRMPTGFLSGGILVCGSGGAFVSGGVTRGAFMRPGDHRYVRARILSGDNTAVPVYAGFDAASKRTGIGPGYSFSPASGMSGFNGVGGF